MNAPTLTHYLVVLYLAASSFIVTPAGQALIHQYPYLAGVATTLSFLGALYHVPSGASPNEQK